MVRISLKSITFVTFFTLLTLMCYFLQNPNLIPPPDVVTVETNIFYQVPPLGSVTYIRSVFRVYDNEIRISTIRLHKSRSSLFYKYGNYTGKVSFICELPSCLDYYSKPCKMIGYIGIIKTVNLGNFDKIYFSTNKKPDSFKIKVKVNDVRVQTNNHSYPHQLGVCVQPIYLHADYFLFINFFEYWLSQGATKFYIYRESYTAEVQKILNFYNSSTSNASIELIDWSQLPSTVVGENVNNYLYRLEMMLSIFDCVTRARSHVKFLAQTDLDEFISIKNSKQKVAEFMEIFEKKNPNFASASFSSQRIAFEKDFLDNFNTPQDITFSFLENVEVENYTFPRPYYSKLVYRPERVLRVHPHKQMQIDKTTSKSQRRFVNALIDNKEALVMHMRRVNDTFTWKKTFNSTMFSTLAKTLTENYQKRLKNYDLENYEWQNIGIQIVEEVNNCRKEVSKNRTRQCHSVFNCEKMLAEKHDNIFIHVNNSWIYV